MNLKCFFGLHDWSGCRCNECGKTRDEQHDWSEDCEKCSQCGKTSDIQNSRFDCKSSKCGKTKEKQLKSDLSLYEITQIISVSAFNKTPLN